MISILLTALLTLQTPPAQASKPPADVPAAPQAALAPGVLPADSTPEAIALWKSLVEALRPKAAADQAPITAFDLSISSRVIEYAGGSRSSNDVQLRFCYQSPGFVSRAIIAGNSEVQTMRGPDGDWTWDTKTDDRTQLAGQDFAQDRRELSQMLSMARNYVALADPARLRIAQLQRMKAPPDGLPALDSSTPKDSALQLVASLEWISVLSPDFQVVERVKSAQPAVFRAQLGLDPVSHLPLLAVIFQDDHGTRVNETAVLIDFTIVFAKTKDKPPKPYTPRYTSIDGHLVPTFFRVHEPLQPSSPFSFNREARTTVTVDKGTLRATLTPDDFRPPKKKE